MPSSIRQRSVHAATVGLAAAALASATQYFVGIPLGPQPPWLGTLATISAVPSAYVTMPLSEPLERWIGAPLHSGILSEVATPFGPAFRVGSDDIALIALGTLVMVGLVAYLANGLAEMIVERR